MFTKTYQFVMDTYMFDEHVSRDQKVFTSLAEALKAKRFWQETYKELGLSITKHKFQITPIWNYEIVKQPKHGVMKPHWEEESYIYYRYDPIVDDKVAWGGTRDVWVTGTFENRIINRDVLKPSRELLESLTEK